MKQSITKQLSKFPVELQEEVYKIYHAYAFLPLDSSGEYLEEAENEFIEVIMKAIRSTYFRAYRDGALDAFALAPKATRDQLHRVAALRTKRDIERARTRESKQKPTMDELPF